MTHLLCSTHRTPKIAPPWQSLEGNVHERKLTCFATKRTFRNSVTPHGAHLSQFIFRALRSSEIEDVDRHIGINKARTDSIDAYVSPLKLVRTSLS